MKRIYYENNFDGKCPINIYTDKHIMESEHTHDFLELLYVVDGEVIHRVDNDFFKLKRGSVLFIDVGQTHSFFAQEKVVFFNIIFKEEIFNTFRDDSINCFEYVKTHTSETTGEKIKPCIQFSSKDCDFIENILSFMEKEYIYKKGNYSEAVSSIFKILCVLVIRKLAEQQVNPVVLNIKEFIDLRSFDNISIKEIADAYGYNPSYLSDKFKRENNQTLTSYIQENRAKAAMILLKRTRWRIERIAQLIGYTDVKQIYKLLKKTYGVTPREIRKNEKKNH